MNEQPDDAIPEDALAHLDQDWSDGALTLIAIEPWIESTLEMWNSAEEGPAHSRAEVISFLEVQLDPLGTSLARTFRVKALPTPGGNDAPPADEAPNGPEAHPAGSARRRGSRQVIAHGLRRMARWCDALAEGLTTRGGTGR